MGLLNFVVGRQKVENLGKPAGFAYLVYSCQESAATKGTWVILFENDIIKSIKAGTAFENVTISGSGNLKGSSGALTRFDSSSSVIINRLVDTSGNTVGYTVASSSRKVARLPVKKVIAYCEDCIKNNRIPFQNAIYHQKGTTDAHIKSYEDCPFKTEVLQQMVNKFAVARKPAATKGNNASDYAEQVKKIYADMEATQSLYTKEQKAQLKLGIDNNVNVACYANPDISWQKMKVIREGLQKGYDIGELTNPDFIVPCKIGALEYLVALRSHGNDISYLLNPSYDLAQICELHVGNINLVDINAYSDPSIPAGKMSEIRRKLEGSFWEDCVKEDKL